MSTLEVWVNAQTNEVDAQANRSDPTRGAQLVGNIYSVESTEWSQRNVVLPIGASVKPATIEVEPGRYVVEAALPSGRLLSHEVEVKAGQTVPVEFDATDAPNADLSWQYIVGNVESAEVYHGDTSVPVPRSKSAQTVLPETVGEEAVAKAGLPGVWCSGDAENGIGFADLLSIAKSESDSVFDKFTSSKWVNQRGDIVPTTDNAGSALFRFTSAEFPELWPHSIGGRRFLLANAEVGRFMVTLPVPWIDVHSNTESVVQVLVNGRQSPFGNPIAVAVLDRSVGAGLAYLANGALSNAATLFGDVEQVLFAKMANPLAAAAAAYVLVGTEATQDKLYWDEWIDNLDKRFQFMSDGSILRATRLLRMARTQSDRQAARDHLLVAVGRGVPIFTPGMSWLIDGLSEFADDDECQEALLRVRQLSWRVDMREPFVIVRMGASK